MFEFRTDSQLQRVRYRDLVLNERAKKILAMFIGIERLECCVFEIIDREPVSSAPNDLVAPAGLEAVLKVKIEGVPLFIERDVIDVVRLVVKLKFHIGIVRLFPVTSS